jgi:hypothetical protein
MLRANILLLHILLNLVALFHQLALMLTNLLNMEILLLVTTGNSTHHQVPLKLISYTAMDQIGLQWEMLQGLRMTCVMIVLGMSKSWSIFYEMANCDQEF